MNTDASSPADATSDFAATALRLDARMPVVRIFSIATVDAGAKPIRHHKSMSVLCPFGAVRVTDRRWILGPRPVVGEVAPRPTAGGDFSPPPRR